VAKAVDNVKINIKIDFIPRFKHSHNRALPVKASPALGIMFRLQDKEGRLGRQFIAVVPRGLDKNSELKKLMGKLKRTLDQRERDVRWTPPALWHVTLQFLGDLTAAQKIDLHALLAEWRPDLSGITLRLHGLGAFPSPEEARVLWVGVQESQDFIGLQENLSALLLAAGFALGEREFKPHLTLARFRNTFNAGDLVQLGGRKHFGDYPLSELILFESVLQGNILKYMPQFRKMLVNDSDSARKE